MPDTQNERTQHAGPLRENWILVPRHDARNKRSQLPGAQNFLEKGPREKCLEEESASALGPYGVLEVSLAKV